MSARTRARNVLILPAHNGSTELSLGCVVVQRQWGSEVMLFGVGATDLSTFAVTLTLVVVLAVASYFPVRRATAIDPHVAVRAG